jgi:hypothetical protein
MTRAIVCGGRHFADRTALFQALDLLHELRSFAEIIHGAAAGADSLAGEWARARGVKETRVPAEWDRFGRAAGFWRNKAMLDLNPDVIIAFAGGKGTQNMIDLADDAGFQVVRA